VEDLRHPARVVLREVERGLPCPPRVAPDEERVGVGVSRGNGNGNGNVRTGDAGEGRENKETDEGNGKLGHEALRSL
jgi:hypothetical protein